MKKLNEQITNVFAAVAFAEQAEWDEAARFTEETSEKTSTSRMEKEERPQETRRKKNDQRPRLHV